MGACATSRPIAASNGSTAYEVSCSNGRWECTAEAERVCNGGHYVVLDEDSALGMASHDRHGSLTIQCIEDYVASSNAPLSTPPNPDGSAGRRPSDAIICERTYADAPRVAADWALVRGGAARALPPMREEFMRACTALPEAAQLCLNPKYHLAHADRCAKTLPALDDAKARGLDAVLLAAAP